MPQEKCPDEREFADESIPDDKTLWREAKYFHALSEPVRLKILHLLRNNQELCVCELESALGKSQSFISYHLKMLVESGIVRRELDGTWSRYSIRDDRCIFILDTMIKENKSSKK